MVFERRVWQAVNALYSAINSPVPIPGAGLRTVTSAALTALGEAGLSDNPARTSPVEARLVAAVGAISTRAARGTAIDPDSRDARVASDAMAEYLLSQTAALIGVPTPSVTDGAPADADAAAGGEPSEALMRLALMRVLKAAVGLFEDAHAASQSLIADATEKAERLTSAAHHDAEQARELRQTARREAGTTGRRAQREVDRLLRAARAEVDKTLRDARTEADEIRRGARSDVAGARDQTGNKSGSAADGSDTRPPALYVYGGSGRRPGAAQRLNHRPTGREMVVSPLGANGANSDTITLIAAILNNPAAVPPRSRAVVAAHIASIEEVRALAVPYPLWAAVVRGLEVAARPESWRNSGGVPEGRAAFHSFLERLGLGDLLETSNSSPKSPAAPPARSPGEQAPPNGRAGSLRRRDNPEELAQ